MGRPAGMVRMEGPDTLADALDRPRPSRLYAPILAVRFGWGLVSPWARPKSLTVGWHTGAERLSPLGPRKAGEQVRAYPGGHAQSMCCGHSRPYLVAKQAGQGTA